MEQVCSQVIEFFKAFLISHVKTFKLLKLENKIDHQIINLNFYLNCYKDCS